VKREAGEEGGWSRGRVLRREGGVVQCLTSKYQL
jgi:hypothetical protein